MDDRTAETALSLTKFGVGQPVRRSEDPKLLRGEGQYTDDVVRPGQAYAVMVRSQEPHGILRSDRHRCGQEHAGRACGLTGADLAGYGGFKCSLPFKNRDGSPIHYAAAAGAGGRQGALRRRSGRLRHRRDRHQAKDAAEAVVVDIEPLPPALKPAEAIKPGAPLIYDEAPNNIALDFHFGDAEKVAEAFAKAAHVTRLEIVQQPRRRQRRWSRARRSPSSTPQPNSYTLYTSSQGVMGMQGQLMRHLRVPADKVHVLTGNVGGSFGMKAAVFPEYVCILHAARELGRPVKWTDERSATFVSDNHGRDHVQAVELALDENAHIPGAAADRLRQSRRLHGPDGPQPPTLNTVQNVASLYRTPLLEVKTKGVFTNTTHLSPIAAPDAPRATTTWSG